MPFRAPVVREGVYFLTSKRARARPGSADDVEPRQLRRVALRDRALARASARRSSASTIVPETTARKLLVSGGRVVGIRTGDRGRGKSGEELAQLRAGLRHPGAGHDPRRGDAGPPGRRRLAALRPRVEARRSTRSASRRSGRSRSRSTASSTRWAGLCARASVTASSAAASSIRWATTMVAHRHGRRARLHRRHALRPRPAAGAEGPPVRPRHPRRRDARGLGGEDDPRGRLPRPPRALPLPGRDDRRATPPGFVNVPALKGIHYAMRSGMLAAEAAVGALGPGRPPGRRARSRPTTRPCARATSGATSSACATCGPRSSTGFVRGALLAGRVDDHARQAPARAREARARRRGPGRPSATATAPTPQPDGQLFFDKLSSVYLSGNKTRDDAPSHIRVDTKVRRELAETWVHMCPAQVYEITRRGEPGRERRRRRGDRLELHPVRRDHGQGRPPDAARGRGRPRIHPDVDAAAASSATALLRTPLLSSETWPRVRRHGAPEGRALPEDGLLQAARACSRSSPRSRRRRSDAGRDHGLGRQHAAALAYGCALEGIDCLVVMWQGASELKRGRGAATARRSTRRRRGPARSSTRLEELRGSRPGGCSSIRSTTRS